MHSDQKENPADVIKTSNKLNLRAGLRNTLLRYQIDFIKNKIKKYLLFILLFTKITIKKKEDTFYLVLLSHKFLIYNLVSKFANNDNS